MGSSVIQRAFAGGELDPTLHARADQSKYVTGLKLCRNWMVLKGGGAANRAGFQFIDACKNAAVGKHLLRYLSELPGESILIEAGNGYLRFFKEGGAVELSAPAAWSGATTYAIGDVVVEGGVNYYAVAPSFNQQPPNASFWYAMPGDLLEVPHPFGTTRFHWEQSGRVLTLTADGVRPHELIFASLERWIIQPIDTSPAIPAPTTLDLTPPAAGARQFSYVVTAAHPETYEESIASNVAAAIGVAAPSDDVPHELSWTPPGIGAAEFYVYCDPFGNGVHGYIGTAAGTLSSFRNPGIEPDFSITPPIPRDLFNATGEYPRTSGTYQQRRLFGNTDTEPDGIFGSRIGRPSNFGISSPLQDDDALQFRLAGRHNHAIRHLIGLKQLVVLTDGGGWTVGEPKRPLTPSNIPADEETYVGASDVKPAVVGNTIIYLEARGRVVYDLRFDEQIQGFGGRDLTLFASHLFRAFTITRLDWATNPDSIVWAVRSDGTLLGLTYIPDQEIWGWHRHTTDGLIEDVCIVPETNDDAVYVIVRRVVDGEVVRYIERLHSREIVAETFDADAFFVDSGLSYSGPPADEISGLDHLEGKSVVALADGEPVGPFTVSGGAIELPAEASNVHVGLAIPNPDIETLALDVAGSDVRDRRKLVKGVSLLVDRSTRRLQAGPTATQLRTYLDSDFETDADEHTGRLELPLRATWEYNGSVYIRASAPLPVTLIGIVPHLDIGG